MIDIEAGTSFFITYLTLAILTLLKADAYYRIDKPPGSRTAREVKYIVVLCLAAWWLLWLFWILNWIEYGDRRR